MRHLVNRIPTCLLPLLITACATAPLTAPAPRRGQKIPDRLGESAGGVRFKNGGGFLSEGGPSFDLGGPKLLGAVMAVGMGGLIIWALASNGSDEEAEPAEPEAPYIHDVNVGGPALDQPLVLAPGR